MPVPAHRAAAVESIGLHAPYNPKALPEIALLGKPRKNTRSARWVLDLVIGVEVALLALLVHHGYELLGSLRVRGVQSVLGEDTPKGDWRFVAAGAVNVGVSTGFALGAWALCWTWPKSQSSGIPGVIAFLNGIDLRDGLFTPGVLFAKVVGVILSCGSSLAVGPEGPMVHIGAAVGTLTLMAASRSPRVRGILGIDGGRRLELHAAAVGAGCGIAAAFRAPFAGTLFVIEEASTYYSTRFFMHVFGASAIAVFVASAEFLVREAEYTLLFEVWTGSGCSELQGALCVQCVGIGLICGCMGCLFNAIVVRLNTWRQRRKDFPRSCRFFLLEVVAISVLSSSAGVVLPALASCEDSSVQTLFQDSNQCIQRGWQSQIVRSTRMNQNSHETLMNPVPGLFGVQYDPINCPKAIDGSQSWGAASCKLEGLQSVFGHNASERELSHYCCGFNDLDGFLTHNLSFDFRRPVAPIYLNRERWPSFGCPGRYDVDNHVWVPAYNPMAALAFVPGHNAVRNLFTRGAPQVLPGWMILINLPVYFLMAAVTAGTYIPSGLVVPMMLIGASVGRLCGVAYIQFFGNLIQPPSYAEVYIPEFLPLISWLRLQGISIIESSHMPDPGTCAVVGAAAFMSGSGSIILFVIAMLVEITGDVKLVVPIAIAAVVGRLVVYMLHGQGLYHDLIEVARLPLLHHKLHCPGGGACADTVLDILVRPQGAPAPAAPRDEEDQEADIERARVHVRYLRLSESPCVLRRCAICPFNGFPVVNGGGRLAGFVRKEDLKRLLAEDEGRQEESIVEVRGLNGTVEPGMPSFQRDPSASSLQGGLDANHQAGLPRGSHGERRGHHAEPHLLSLEAVMDVAPHSVCVDVPLFRAHTLFTRMGLRHLTVVDHDHRPVGVLTRSAFLGRPTPAAAAAAAAAQAAAGERVPAMATPGSPLLL